MISHPQNLKAVIFDLDGTLVDTAAEFVVAVQALRAEHGHAEMDPERIRASVSNGARSLVSVAFDMPEHASEFESRRLRLLDLYGEVLGSVAQPYPGINELLAEFSARGIAWGVATNKPRLYAQPLMDSLSFTPPPGSLVCPDDVDERKPHPESLLLNCKELGCSPSQAIYVGDHQRDIEAGIRAGMYTIAAHYGYIEPDDDPHGWGADAFARCSTELHDLIFKP